MAAAVPATAESYAMAAWLDAMLDCGRLRREVRQMIVLYTTERDYPWGTLRSTHASKT
jgi:hypothetical protein